MHRVWDTYKYQARDLVLISSRRGQLVSGPRYPLPKTENSWDLVHYFSGWGPFTLIFSYFHHLIYFFRSDSMTSVPPSPLATSQISTIPAFVDHISSEGDSKVTR